MFLASVTSLAEAEIALGGGADIIDCKDPSQGALGALPGETVRAIRAGLPRTVPVSATIGDLAGPPETIVRAVEAMAAAGVDYVKIGFFPGSDAPATIACLGERPLQGCRLVGLLLADHEPDFALVGLMGKAGFAGAMLDTGAKSAGPLSRFMPQYRLDLFVREAHRNRLFAGLAGSLRLVNIATLAPLGADILGFRGALCRAGKRTGQLDARAVASVRRTMDEVAGVVRKEMRSA